MPKDEKWRTALDEFAARVRKMYDGRLQTMILYGSRARDTADEGSDVDVLVVLNPLGDFWTEFSRLQSLAGSISLEHHVVLCPLPVSADDLEEPKTPLLMNAAHDGVRVA